jgi:hypothetical protein
MSFFRRRYIFNFVHMTIAKLSELGITHLPDHTELPESDGTLLEQEQQKSDRMAQKLRQLRINPDEV